MAHALQNGSFEEADELLDLVTADDVHVGTVLREAHHAHPDKFTSKGQYFRGVAAWLLNDSGQLWLPTRHPNRKIVPSGYDFSMAEHVQAGEGRLEAAQRGMEEELNLIVSFSDLTLLGTIRCDDIGALITLYGYHFNGEPDFNKKDYSSGQWLLPDEALTLVEAGLSKSGVKEGILLAADYLKQGG